MNRKGRFTSRAKMNEYIKHIYYLYNVTEIMKYYKRIKSNERFQPCQEIQPLLAPLC